MSYILNADLTNEENHKKVALISSEIDACLRGVAMPTPGMTVLAAYVLSKDSEREKSCSYEELCENELGLQESILMEVQEKIGCHEWKSLTDLHGKYTAKEFALTAVLVDLSASGMKYAEPATPDSLIKLAEKILAIQAGEKVADIGCGYGSFLNSILMQIPEARCYGYDINYSRKLIADIRAELLQQDAKIEVRDAFTLIEDQAEAFDKVFSNYPFGMKLSHLGEGTKMLSRMVEEYPGLSKATSSDWVFNALLCELMKPTGKAVGIMTNGSTWNSIDMMMRKYFVEKGLVEAVVSLPARMFSFTNIPTTMIVLSHGNQSVRLVDASGLCQEGRRINEFSDVNIDQIIMALHQDTEFSKCVSLETLKESEYVLSPSRYLQERISIRNAVPFETVIKSISRGAPCTAKQLDEMASDSVTNMQYLMLANIKEGMIDNKLPYLSHIDSRFEKYCLKDNTLILSKNGYPYKVAVSRIHEGQQILANGNLYMIELDEQRVNPYYLKAFFESEQGIASLKSITVGATIPSIGVDKLKKLKVPVPPMEEQQKIVERYLANLDEIAVLKLKLEKAISRLHHIFDEERE